MNLDNIAKLAFTLPDNKTNKKAVVNIIKDLLFSGEYDDKLSAEKQAALYKFCLPPRKTKPKTDFEWVAKAVNPKEIREYLRFVYSDGEYIYGTNGYIAHRFKTGNYEPGFYTLQGVKTDCDLTYPDISRVIPKDLLDSCEYKTLEVRHSEDKDRVFRAAYRIPGWEGIGISQVYLDNAIKFFTPHEPSILYSKDKTKPGSDSIKIQFRDTHTVVIMAVKFSDE